MMSLEAIRVRVLRDFDRTVAADAQVRLVDFDPSRPEEVEAVVPAARSWVDPAAPSRHRLLLRIADNVTSLDDAAGDEAALTVEVASSLQDFVIDETGRPWPEVVHAGRATVLDPAVASDGRACWVARGDAFCEIGDLAERLTS